MCMGSDLREPVEGIDPTEPWLPAGYGDRAQIGEPCSTCGRPRTELGGGGLFAYCWWCHERAGE